MKRARWPGGSTPCEGGSHDPAEPAPAEVEGALSPWCRRDEGRGRRPRRVRALRPNGGSQPELRRPGVRRVRDSRDAARAARAARKVPPAGSTSRPRSASCCSVTETARRATTASSRTPSTPAAALEASATSEHHGDQGGLAFARKVRTALAHERRTGLNPLQLEPRSPAALSRTRVGV